MRPAAALVASFLVACTVLPEADHRPDGAVCTKSAECKSGQCLSGRGDVCDGSACRSADACQPGWTCVHFPATSGLLGSTPEHDACRPSCASCPEHHRCEPGDSFCKPDPTWAAPKVTATEGRTIEPGTTVSFHADATSPIGDADLRFEWAFPSDDGKDQRRIEGQDGTMTPQSGGSVYRATVTVTDSSNRRTTVDVDFEVCGRTGTACTSDPGAVPCCGGAACASFTCR